MARDVHGRRLAGARDLPTDRQGLASRASGRLRGGLPLSQGRGLAAGAGGASRAARVAAERAGPPGPRGAGERRGTQAAPPAARRGTGRDRPRTRQDLGPWDRQPHARRAKIPRGDEPEDAGQGLRAECSRCWSSCRCRIPQASIPTPSSPRGGCPRPAAPPSSLSRNSRVTRTPTSRWGGCGRLGPPRAATARADSLAAQVLARRGPHVPAWLVRAEASFQTGRDSAGYAWYDSALGHADLDSSGALWANARLIATPDEAARFAATGPGDARRF